MAPEDNVMDQSMVQRECLIHMGGTAQSVELLVRLLEEQLKQASSLRKASMEAVHGPAQDLKTALGRLQAGINNMQRESMGVASEGAGSSSSASPVDKGTLSAANGQKQGGPIDFLLTGLTDPCCTVDRSGASAKAIESEKARKPLVVDMPSDQGLESSLVGENTDLQIQVKFEGEQKPRRPVEDSPEAAAPGEDELPDGEMLPEPAPEMGTVHSNTNAESVEAEKVNSNGAASEEKEEDGKSDIVNEEEDRAKKRKSRQSAIKVLEAAPLSTTVSASKRHLVRLGNVKKEKGIMFPHWTSKLTWDLFVMFVVVSDSLILPFQLAFKHGKDADAFDEFWFYFSLIVFSSDLVACFNTAVAPGDNEVKGPDSMIQDRKTIAKLYLRGWFVIDFVSTFPWTRIAPLISGGGGGPMEHVTKLLKMLKFLRIVRLMKMLRAKKIKDIWERVEVAIGSVVVIQAMMLARVLLIVVTICHWNACIFWIVGSPQSLVTELLPELVKVNFEKLPHWTTVQRVSGSAGQEPWSWSEKSTSEAYIFCFYWTLGVMRTMPAEVTPTNLVERVFVLCFMFFALSAFAISVASLTQAYFKIFERGRGFGDEMFAIRMCLARLKVCPAAQRKIKDYLGHLFERRRIMAKEANLLDKLPAVLKAEVTHAKTLQYLSGLSLLPELQPEIVAELCRSVETFDLLAGQIICTEGKEAKAAWIICSGHVQAYDSEGELDGNLEIIDEEALYDFGKVHSSLTVQTLTCCEVCKIDKPLFLRLVEQSSEGPSLKKQLTFGGPQQIGVKEASADAGGGDGAAAASTAALAAG
eukprot:TRINITY_DN48617_c0_g1_i1.p1 TRINITY_DN48617_c0_g1~~TRINITY_DN48617_c0_g1_i1.p1  ORF type:complete len:810 (-),score=166.33 TRINITY_DN48617_c0_g1_i1:141-2570(-)